MKAVTLKFNINHETVITSISFSEADMAWMVSSQAENNISVYVFGS